mgnify:CR=1 FL=1
MPRYPAKVWAIKGGPMKPNAPKKTDYIKSLYIFCKYFKNISGIVSQITCRKQPHNRSTGSVYIMVGFSKSGKTSVCKQHPQLAHLPRIESAQIHALLNLHIPDARDDNTVNGSRYWIRQLLTKLMVFRAFIRLSRQNVSFVLDSCHLTKKSRSWIIRHARLSGYSTTILFVNCHEDELIRRLNEADSENILQGKEPAWLDLYEEVQRLQFEPPTEDEADTLITITTSPSYHST